MELLQNIPRIYTAIAECGAAMLYVLLLKKNIKIGKFTILTTVFFVFQTFLLTMTPDLSDILWLLVMSLAFLCIILFIYFSCEFSVKTAAYYGLRAIILAEFMASFAWQLIYYLIYYKNFIVPNQSYILLVIIYAIGFTVTYKMEKAYIKLEHAVDISKKELINSGIIATFTFVLGNLSFISMNTPFSSRYPMEIFTIRTLADLGGIGMLYFYQSHISNMKADKEINAINETLRNQYNNYLKYQESIDIVNLKYHDLKHQIAGLKAETDPQKWVHWLEVLEQEVGQFELENKTGNSVLDTILASKIGICRKNHIEFTCVADGSAIEGLNVRDICTIFGNALDNAIESVVLESDLDKRLILLSVIAKREFIMITVENHCAISPVFKDGLPVTSKLDQQSHGYGVKSIYQTVEKYNGSVTFKYQDNWFNLIILIPSNHITND